MTIQVDSLAKEFIYIEEDFLNNSREFNCFIEFLSCSKLIKKKKFLRLYKSKIWVMNSLIKDFHGEIEKVKEIEKEPLRVKKIFQALDSKIFQNYTHMLIDLVVFCAEKIDFETLTVYEHTYNKEFKRNFNVDSITPVIYAQKLTRIEVLLKQMAKKSLVPKELKRRVVIQVHAANILLDMKIMVLDYLKNGKSGLNKIALNHIKKSETHEQDLKFMMSVYRDYGIFEKVRKTVSLLRKNKSSFL